MSHKSQILKHLKKGKGISQLLSFKMFGYFGLAKRIKELRDEGHPIETVMTTHAKKRFAVYKLRR